VVTYEDILRCAGYPLTALVLDFETFFDKKYSLKKLSTIEYIEDPRFEILGLAYLRLGSVARFEPKAAVALGDFQQEYGPDLEGVTVVCHNARFDCTILARKFGIKPPFIIDTMNLSAHLDARNKHSLEKVAERLKLNAKGDTKAFLKLHAADLVGEKLDLMTAYATNDAKLEGRLLEILLPHLTRPEIELRLIRHTLRLFIEPELAFDPEYGLELLAKMEAEIDAAVVPTGLDRETISANLAFAEKLGEALAAVGEKIPTKQGKRGPIPALAKTDTQLDGMKNHPDAIVRALIRARQAVKSWPLHIKRIKAMAAQSECCGGLFPNALKYYGAHTGRWAGGEGTNSCNLPTREGGLASEVKHCLVARPGTILILADAAQIEARGVAWEAGQQDLMDAFRDGTDIYSAFASEVLGVEVHKPAKEDADYQFMYTRRQMGKQAILALGYGMGPSKFIDRLEKTPETRELVQSGQVDAALCDRLVQTYRQQYSLIPKLWYDTEAAFRHTVDTGQPTLLKNLRINKIRTTAVITLPSGRRLFYPHVVITGRGRMSELRYHWGHLWGGTLIENITQAISRDVLAEAILYVEDHGFRVAHHCYDSIVAAVPLERKEEALACVSDAFKRVPLWATGWPLDVEAKIADKYD
jgi:DNA polymerase